MDQFIVSARKYRPITFDGMVGQKHVGETLKNAIRSNHLAQAFLFNGPRGVGKTTCARILAKTINCQDRNEAIEACDKCESCKSFNEGHSLNVYELDAASNNKVEDIRALIEQVRFAPQLGTKKVYIIDEVHMLSTSAFNAFLKTLEEPPAHAIFILATTEKHKILPTILSRCQVFDFNRIEISDIVRHLGEIAEKENIKTEDEALNLLALKAEGSLRDALSMFDQMVTFSENNLTYDSVVESLSILSLDHFFNLTDYLVQNDISNALLLFNEILHKGFDGHNFLLGFAEHLRNLLVAQDHRTIELLTLGDQIIEKYRDQTMRVSSPFIIKSLNLISKADVQYKAAQNQRLLVELTLINLASLSAGEAPKTNTAPSEEPVKKKRPEAEPIVESAAPKAVEKPKVQVDEKKAVVVEKPAQVSEPTDKAEQSDSTKEVVEDEKPIESALVAAQTESVSVEEKKAIEEVDRSEEIEAVVAKKKEPAPEPIKVKPQVQVVSDSISIADFTKKDEASKSKDDAEALKDRNEAVSESQFKESWDLMIKNYQEKGKINLYSTLTKYEPNFNEALEIEITYDNKAQLQFIESERSSMLEFLRDALKNDKLSLKVKISDAKHQRAYTPAEKLEKLIEKNPNIGKLKDQLDLDLGH